MRWDTRLYFAAHQQVVNSRKRWAEGKIFASVNHAACARMAFIANLAINIASFPLAIIWVTFGSIVALSHWNFKMHLFTQAFQRIKTKTNHILLSALGAACPSLAYRFRAANLAPYIIALRIGALIWGLIYAFTC